MKTAMQEAIDDLRKHNLEMSTQKSIADWLEACFLSKEKEQLISMCNIGSTNPGIKGEDVYNFKATT